LEHPKTKIAPCSRSGNCCRGQGRTPVSQNDAKVISEFLKESLFDFYEKFTYRVDGIDYLRTTPNDPTLACYFLQNNLCSINEVKPAVCKTWPLWLRLAKSAKDYHYAQSYCSMIRSVTHEDFIEAFKLSNHNS
jgi:Fe-S-cluster containining protein